MKLLLTGHEERYAIEQLQLSLFPGEQMEPVYGPFQGDGAESILSRGEVYLTATTVIWYRGRKSQCVRRMHLEAETVQLRRRLLQRSYYGAACPLLPEPPPWGALAGVRPTKITTKFLMEGGSLRAAGTMLKQIYYVTPTRRQLCLEASQATVQAAKLLGPRDISLYVGIPFCPTRCAYCSFVSSATSRSGGMVEPYLQALIREIQGVGRMLASSGLRARTLYIGGGTPTTLTASQLNRLLDVLGRSLDLSGCLEYTVEAGRPDTITQEKLQVLARHGVGRVSINPQSMDDRVLALCGRRHKAIQIPESSMARQGLEAINMDSLPACRGHTAGFRFEAALGRKHHGAHPGPKRGADPTSIRSACLVRGGRETGASRITWWAGLQPYYLTGKVHVREL
ncbi:MAG: radical SAM protein [Oscillospiraceae bacterium]